MSVGEKCVSFCTGCRSTASTAEAANQRLKQYANGDETWAVDRRGGAKMKVSVQIIVEHEGLDGPIVEEVACLCRGDLMPETLGLNSG